MKKTSALIFLLIIFGIFMATIIIQGQNVDSYFCSPNSGCEIVQNSPYALILGFKVVYLGLFGFIALLIVYILASLKKIPKRIFLISALIGSAFAIYFIVVQFFIIKEICRNCMIIDSTMIVITLLALYESSVKS